MDEKEKYMNVTQALLASSHIVCYTCQRPTPHSVWLDPEPLFVFTCMICGDQIDEKEAEITLEGRNTIEQFENDTKGVR